MKLLMKDKEHYGVVPGTDRGDGNAKPKVGKAATSAQLDPINLDEVRAAMAETIEETKANDPKELRAEVARLRRELATQRPPAVQVPSNPWVWVISFRRLEPV